MARNTLKVEYIKENNITEMKCSKKGDMLPISEFRIHKGYYMSYCKDWERTDNRKRSQARIWKNIELEDGTVLEAKTTRMKDSILISSNYTTTKLYFSKDVDKDQAIEAFSKYTEVYHDITYVYK